MKSAARRKQPVGVVGVEHLDGQIEVEVAQLFFVGHGLSFAFFLLTGPAVLEPDVDAFHGQVESDGQLVHHLDIRIVHVLERVLQCLELSKR